MLIEQCVVEGLPHFLMTSLTLNATIVFSLRPHTVVRHFTQKQKVSLVNVVVNSKTCCWNFSSTICKEGCFKQFFRTDENNCKAQQCENFSKFKSGSTLIWLWNAAVRRGLNEAYKKHASRSLSFGTHQLNAARVLLTSSLGGLTVFAGSLTSVLAFVCTATYEVLVQTAVR